MNNYLRAAWDLMAKEGKLNLSIAADDQAAEEKRSEEIRSICERFLLASALLPEGEVLGWEFEARELKNHLFTSGRSAVSLDDLNWIFNPLGQINVLRGRRYDAKETQNAESSLYIISSVEGSMKDSVRFQHNNGAGHNSTVLSAGGTSADDGPVFELFAMLAESEAVIRLMAGPVSESAPGHGMMLVSLQGRMPLRMKALFSQAFPHMAVIDPADIGVEDQNSLCLPETYFQNAMAVFLKTAAQLAEKAAAAKAARKRKKLSGDKADEKSEERAAAGNRLCIALREILKKKTEAREEEEARKDAEAREEDPVDPVKEEDPYDPDEYDLYLYDEYYRDDLDDEDEPRDLDDDEPDDLDDEKDLLLIEDYIDMFGPNGRKLPGLDDDDLRDGASDKDDSSKDDASDKDDSSKDDGSDKNADPAKGDGSAEGGDPDDDDSDNIRIDDLELSVRAYNCLRRAGIATIGDLRKCSDVDLRAIRNLGNKSFIEVRETLLRFDKENPPKKHVGKRPETGSEETSEAESPESREYREALDKLIGLTEVKEQLKKIAALARLKKDMRKRGMDVAPFSLNMVFTGNPGTAKTTVARIAAGLFYEAGLLKKVKLVEVGRADLVASYEGQTADKVKRVFDRADGGVLFIDEAYSLVEGHDGAFGDEAINTIVQEMENRRDMLVVIFAGYPDSMEGFFARNPGLRSRVPYTLHFSDYSADELVRIAETEAGKHGFSISEEASEALYKTCLYASSHPELGNGRFVRNLVEEAIVSYAGRIYQETDAAQADDQQNFTLIASDFTLQSVQTEPERGPVGFQPAKKAG